MSNILRLRCPCPHRIKGANLADVTQEASNPDWTEFGLTVCPRPGVTRAVDDRYRGARRRRPRGSFGDYRAWHEANRHYIPLDERTGDANDWHARTYLLHCRCGRTHTFTSKRLADLWQRLNVPSKASVVYAVLGVDL